MRSDSDGTFDSNAVNSSAKLVNVGHFSIMSATEVRPYINAY
jgi:hypothetical protein